MSPTIDREAAVCALVPINRLPPENQRVLFEAGEFLTVFDGAVVYVQGHQDEYVHYLLDGAVELLWNGEVVKRLPAGSKAARRALDKPGRKRYTVRAVTNSVVVRFTREVYDAQLEEGNLLTGPRQVEVSEITAEKSSNWMIKMLQSELFERLPAINIQKIFGRMERIPVTADEVIIGQGGVGDYYYVIERGYCEVSRKIHGGKEIHLADLGAGDAFGETAIIAGAVRNASVTMLTDGTLMRLAAADFNELIRAPLLHGLNGAAAIAEIEGGAEWLDIRYPEDYAKQPLKQSHNIPFNVLRLQANRLASSRKYIVCADDETQSAVGAYLLIERGFNVDYLNEPISRLIETHDNLADRPASHPSRDRGERVVAFPGVADPHAAPAEQPEIEESMMANHDSDNVPLENTIDKIDRLYEHKQWEAESANRVPVDTYAQTVTGQHLANLIDEMEENTHRLPQIDHAEQTSSASGGAALGPGEVFDVSSAAGADLSATNASDVLLVDTRAPMPVSHEDILEDDLFDDNEGLTQIVQDFEYRIRDYVESASYKRVLEVEERYQEKMARIRKAAAIEVRKRQELARQRYEQHYKRKELQLRAHYKKLMALANKISEQKAQLQQAKLQFEEKLSAANAVYKQVEDMRKTLRQHITGLPGAAGTGADDEGGQRQAGA